MNSSLIATQHNEQPGCGNTESGSAWDRHLRLCCAHLRLLSCMHRNLRASSRHQLTVRVPNPRLRTPGWQESVSAAGLRPRWTWHEPSPPESSPPRYARIAITPDTVRPARRVVIVEVERNESAAMHPPTKGLLFFVLL